MKSYLVISLSIISTKDESKLSIVDVGIDRLLHATGAT